MAKLIEVGEIGHLDFLIQIPRYTKTRTRVRASEREQTVTGVRLKKEIMHMPGQCQEVHMNPNQRPNRPNPPRGPFFPNSRADSPSRPTAGAAPGDLHARQGPAGCWRMPIPGSVRACQPGSRSSATCRGPEQRRDPGAGRTRCRTQGWYDGRMIRAPSGMTCVD